MTKAHGHSWQQCPKQGWPLGQKSETPNSQNTERNYNSATRHTNISEDLESRALASAH